MNEFQNQYTKFIEIPKEKLNNCKIVLFGAGSGVKLFRNQYPEFKIAYLVDNDIKKWGTYVEGLEVRMPEELIKEKHRTIVLITSMYFVSISKQLERFGYIEGYNYFNAFTGTLHKVTCKIDPSDLQKTFESFKDAKINYAILRGFEDLPRWKSDDIDILIDYKDVKEALKVDTLNKVQDGLQLDMYVTGNSYEYKPYFPLQLAQKILKEREEVFELYSVPSLENYFYSYVYHILYYKSSEYVIKNNNRWEIDKNSKYYKEVKRVLDQLDWILDASDAEKLREYLNKKGYRPHIDKLRKMKLETDNEYLQYVIRDTENEYMKKYHKYKELEIMFYVYRRKEYSSGEFGKIIRILRSEFLVLQKGKLSREEVERFSNDVRGGNWRDTHKYLEGNDPIGYIICVDLEPKLPERNILHRNPYLSNENYNIKHIIREQIGGGKFNILHSSDDKIEAWEYIENLDLVNQEKILESLEQLLEKE